jgi:hypothetical protein
MLKLPNLSPRVGRLRTGIPGHVIDMAYDEANDRFYMLTASADYSGPKLYRMDTLGKGAGQVELPEEAPRVSGVAMTSDGIALITPGQAGEIFVINDSGTIIRRSGALLGAGGDDRRGLVWDRLGYVQGVISADNSLFFRSTLEHMTEDSPLRVHESSPVVLPTVTVLNFFGLAFDPSSSDVNKRTYWATDTSGAFFRFDREKFFSSGVEAAPAVPGYVSREVSLDAITPNPLRGASDVRFTLRSRRSVTLDLYDASGVRVMPIFEGSLEAGDHTAHLDAAGLASGVYFIALSAGAGVRDVRPVVVVK